MVVVEINRKLVRVRPIDLPVGLQVMFGVKLESRLFVGVRQVNQIFSVFGGKLLLQFVNRRVIVNRLVTRKNAFSQKIFRIGSNGKLKIAV